MSDLSTGTASVIVGRSPDVVWAALADITRMGEWSPECIAGRWVGGATGPATGASFEGDNVAKVGGRVMKRWTTTSKVTACEPGVVFEFVAEELTTWRYEFTPVSDGDGESTRVTETFSYAPKGVQGFVYETLLRRRSGMTKGMQATLDRAKAVIEAS